MTAHDNARQARLDEATERARADLRDLLADASEAEALGALNHIARHLGTLTSQPALRLFWPVVAPITVAVDAIGARLARDESALSNDLIAAVTRVVNDFSATVAVTLGGGVAACAVCLEVVTGPHDCTGRRPESGADS